MKKLISILIALSMLLCLVPAMADETDGVSALVGVYCPVNEEKNATQADSDALCAMVEQAFGKPILVGVAEDKAAAMEMLDGLDGLVFCPGESIVKEGYDPSKGITDNADMSVIQAAIELKLPILAIDRGALVLNELMGGSTEAQFSVDDEQLLRKTAVVSDEESYMGMAMGGAGTYEVDSYHNVRIESLSPDLVATAVADDGTIEAFEQVFGGECMMIGVQFRPERLAAKGLAGYSELFRLITETGEINRYAAVSHGE